MNCKKSWQVQAEVAGRSNMIIKFPGSHIVLEFKRIRLNALSPPSQLKDGYPEHPKHANWNIFIQHKVIECLNEYSTDQLYSKKKSVVL